MADPSDLHRLIRPYVPKAPQPLIDLHLRLAAADFMSRTKIYRLSVEKVMESDDPIFAPTMPHATVIEFIEAAWWNAEKIDPAPYASFSPTELAEVSNTARWITQLAEQEMRVVPAADGTLVANLICSLTTDPSERVYEIPDFIVKRHSETLACGALARLLAMPGEWHDPAIAGERSARFEAAVNRFTGSNHRGQQRTPRRVRSRFI